MRSASFGWRRQISSVSLPHFAMQSVAPDIGQSSSVATQKYPSSPVSRSSTPLTPECSESVTMDSPVSAVDVDRGVVDSPELGEVVASGLSTITSRFSPLIPQLSPVSMISVLQIVVESPMSYEALVGSKNMCPAAGSATSPSGVSGDSCRLCSCRPTECPKQSGLTCYTGNRFSDERSDRVV